jgi:Outer membrane lipoprotein-sorting protein
MTATIHHCLALLCAALAGASVQAADDVPALLKAADRYRTGADNLQVETHVSVLNRDGSADKERRYTVFVQAQHKSLVLMRSPAEAGQKVLMLGDDFWLLMPGSQRPLRITPSQKLLGDASTGDIATLSWADDYTGNVVGDEPCGAESDAVCQHLSLQATRKGVSYQRIELWLGKARHEPVRADLYVQSDKLAKQARFVLDRPAAPTLVTEMVLLDQLSNHKETRVRYVSRQGKTVPETWLNPMFLARNPALE